MHNDKDTVESFLKTRCIMH